MPKLCDGTIENPTLKESKAFCEGIAYRASDVSANVPPSGNPHTVDSDDYEAWLRGWVVADDLAGGVIPADLAGCCGTIGLEVSDSTGPAWLSLPAVRVPQGDPWDLNLRDYVIGQDPITFALDAGGPPTGILLESDGSFSGTVTNAAGSGSAIFIATNADGSSISGTLSWTIGVS